MPNDPTERPYNVYRSGPRGLKSRLRGEEKIASNGEPPRPVQPSPGRPEAPGGPGGPQRRVYSSRRWNWPPDWRWPWRREGAERPSRRPITVGRVIKYLVIALVLWVGISFVLFMIS